MIEENVVKDDVFFFFSKPLSKYPFFLQNVCRNFRYLQGNDDIGIKSFCFKINLL